MPIIDHNDIPETPWRPSYRKWDITRPGDGTTSSSLSRSIVGIGAGAPLHTHEADELIVILEGTLEVRLGDEVHTVGPDHTLVVPPGTPHGFKHIGPGEAHILVFFSEQDPLKRMTFLEGGPSAAHR